MNERIKQNALRAVARVALSLTAGSAVACGGATVPTASGQDYVTGAAPDTAAPGEGSAQSVDAGCDAARTDEDPRACGAVLAATAADPAFTELLGYRWEEPATMPSLSADLVACCEEHLAQIEQHDGGPWEAEHRWLCCNVGGGGENARTGACTPWGPPVPPAMPQALRAVA